MMPEEKLQFLHGFAKMECKNKIPKKQTMEDIIDGNKV